MGHACKLVSGQSNVLMRIASWDQPAHWSRNLHALISRWNLSIPVSVSSVCCPCLFRNKISNVPWPVLKLRDWLEIIFRKTEGALIMNGFGIDNPKHEHELSAFWQLYENVLPSHEVFKTHRGRLSKVIPMYYHGDEGRGKLRRSVLVTSFVAGLPAPGHSFLSRFLAAIFPGERYAVGLDGMESLEALHGEIAEDLKSLFETGFNAQASIFFNGLDVRSCAFTFLIW